MKQQDTYDAPLHSIHARQSDRAMIELLTLDYLNGGGKIETVASNDDLSFIVSMRRRNQGWSIIAKRLNLSIKQVKDMLQKGLKDGTADRY